MRKEYREVFEKIAHPPCFGKELGCSDDNCRFMKKCVNTEISRALKRYYWERRIGIRGGIRWKRK